MSKGRGTAYDPDDMPSNQGQMDNAANKIKDLQDPNRHADHDLKVHGEASISIAKKIQDLQNPDSDAARTQRAQQDALDLQECIELVEELLDEELEEAKEYLKEKEELDEEQANEIAKENQIYQQAWANYLAQEKKTQQDIILIQDLTAAQRKHELFLNDLIREKMAMLESRISQLKDQKQALDAVYSQVTDMIITNTKNMIDKLDIQDFKSSKGSYYSLKEHIKETVEPIFEKLRKNEIQPKDFIPAISEAIKNSTDDYIEKAKIANPEAVRERIQERLDKCADDVITKLETDKPLLEVAQVVSDESAAIQEEADVISDLKNDFKDLLSDDEPVDQLAAEQQQSPSMEQLVELDSKLVAAEKAIKLAGGDPEKTINVLQKASEALQSAKEHLAQQQEKPDQEAKSKLHT